MMHTIKIIFCLPQRKRNAIIYNMKTRTGNDRTIKWNLLILLLIISVTGAMLTCTRPEMNSGAGSFDAQTAATREPVLGTVYADDFNETDTDSGLTAVHTMQSRLLTLSKVNKEKEEGTLYLVVLLFCSAVCGMYVQHFLHPNLSRLVLRRRAVIVYIYSQDGFKA